jgi:hypothetical protein
MSSVHPDLAHVAHLLGSWSGTGRGEYPTIPSFDYYETITFGHVGKAFLAYSQTTRTIPADDTAPMPMHAESGFWRFPRPGRVEMLVTHPTGIGEIEEGTIEVRQDGVMVIQLATTVVTRTASAKEVTALERTFRITDDTIEYTLRMAAVGLPLQHHLAATLTRT